MNDIHETLARALINKSAPGEVTMIDWAHPDGIVVQSHLDSPFTDHTPSIWRTVISREDGDVIESIVIKQSTPFGA